jgi:hypothetical protein
MKKLLFMCLVLTGCAQVVASNEKSITIKAPPSAQGEAFQKAQEHCQNFKKSAVPSGTVYGNSTVFRCE